MTENEYTNEQLIDFMYDVMDWRDVVDHPMIYAVIEELKEIQQYRAIGTVEEIQKKMEELERWHTDRINENIKNPFAYTSTSVCHNCDHKDEYIEELETEVTEYKSIGTIEEFKVLKNKHIGKDNMVISSSDLMTILNSVSEELKQYKEVGTVEEFKALKEKSEPKKAKWIFDDFTAMFGNPYHCSNCDEEFGDTYYYCPNCGCNMYD